MRVLDIRELSASVGCAIASQITFYDISSPYPEAMMKGFKRPLKVTPARCTALVRGRGACIDERWKEGIRLNPRS